MVDASADHAVALAALTAQPQMTAKTMCARPALWFAWPIGYSPRYPTQTLIQGRRDA
jgi:hypothetical protein